MLSEAMAFQEATKCRLLVGKKREDASSSSRKPAFDSRRAVEHKDKPIHLRIFTNIFAFEIGSCSATDVGASLGSQSTKDRKYNGE
jgi:hypothetical protein